MGGIRVGKALEIPMETIRFYPLEISYKVEGKKNLILLYCKTEEDKSIILIDDQYLPYFYVRTKNTEEVKEKLQKISFEIDGEIMEVQHVERTEKHLRGEREEVLKVTVNRQKALLAVQQIVLQWSSVLDCYEADLPMTRKYLLDNQVTPFSLTEAQVESLNGVNKIPIYKIHSIIPTDGGVKTPLKVLAFDVMTSQVEEESIDPSHNPIIVISFYSEHFKKIVTWKPFPVQSGEYHFVQSEAELLEYFAKVVREYRPDILLGYKSDQYDLYYILERAKKYHLSLDLGLDGTGVRSVQHNALKIHGCCHLDLYQYVTHMLAKEMPLSSYTLSHLAKEMFSEESEELKIHAFPNIYTAETISLYGQYSLGQARKCYLLFNAIEQDLHEYIKLTGYSPFDLVRSSYAAIVEGYIIREASLSNELIQRIPSYSELQKRRQKSFLGGFVLEPIPGIYENIHVCDFRSMYASIISTYNIDPGTLRCSCCRGNTSTTSVMDVKHDMIWFCQKKQGFLPRIITDLLHRKSRIRDLIERESNEVLRTREKSLRLLTHAFYGYMGYPGARWYDLDAAKTITSIGRYYVKKVIAAFKEKGFMLLYSDTDSVFLRADRTALDQFVHNLNATLPDQMAIEYDGTFKKAFFVKSKDEMGAKKKYALLDEKGKLIIKGFESVKRNYSNISRVVQEEVLRIILKEEDREKAVSFVRQVIERIKAGKVHLEEVIIRTQLSKEISKYESKPPHVRVAMRMRNRNIQVSAGSIIGYVIVPGDGSIADRARLPSEVAEGGYDENYYILNQVLPAVEYIFESANIPIQDLLIQKQQSKLEKFI